MSIGEIETAHPGEGIAGSAPKVPRRARDIVPHPSEGGGSVNSRGRRTLPFASRGRGELRRNNPGGLALAHRYPSPKRTCVDWARKRTAPAHTRTRPRTPLAYDSRHETVDALQHTSRRMGSSHSGMTDDHRELVAGVVRFTEQLLATHFGTDPIARSCHKADVHQITVNDPLDHFERLSLDAPYIEGHALALAPRNPRQEQCPRPDREHSRCELGSVLPIPRRESEEYHLERSGEHGVRDPPGCSLDAEREDHRNHAIVGRSTCSAPEQTEPLRQWAATRAAHSE